MTLQPWFREAKLGIFLHWGVYAVDGVGESWSFYDGRLTQQQYYDQLRRFTASAYDPGAWADVFRRAGAGYAVLTTKHHDGVALWDTDEDGLSVVRDTPAGRDLIGPYVDALRERGLRVGLYFSHLDWSHPDYASVRSHDPTRPWMTDHPLTMPLAGAEDPERWERFLRFHRAQLREITSRYRPDLLWFDGHWERSAEQWRMADVRAELDRTHPDTVINGRMLGFGDYATPEQGVPIERPEGVWELCATIGDAWGYQPSDTRHQSVRELVRLFVETIGHGGNLLLNTGPREDGSLRPEHVEVLEGLGSWITRHTDAVHGTVAGLPYGHHYGPSLLSADHRTVFLVCFDEPRGFVDLKGVRNEVRRVSVVGSGEHLDHRVVGGFPNQGVPGTIRIDAPALPDPHATVLAVELDGEVDLYRGAGHG